MKSNQGKKNKDYLNVSYLTISFYFIYFSHFLVIVWVENNIFYSNSVYIYKRNATDNHCFCYFSQQEGWASVGKEIRESNFKKCFWLKAMSSLHVPDI